MKAAHLGSALTIAASHGNKIMQRADENGGEINKENMKMK